MDPETGLLSVRGLEFRTSTWRPAGAPRATALLLHGFPQTAASYGTVARALAGAGVLAVAVDQRGYSPGARPDGVAAYARAELVADVVAFADALGPPVHLVGHDWGGVVGWSAVTAHPERFASWTALSTPAQAALDAVLGSSGPEGQEQRERFGYIRVFRQPGRAEGALTADGAARLRALYAGAVAPERVEQDVAALLEPGALTAALNWYRAMDPADGAGVTPVRVPTTYIWGSADLAFGRPAAEATARAVAADYRFVELTGASHWLVDEAPDVIAAEVLARIG